MEETYKYKYKYNKETNQIEGTSEDLNLCFNCDKESIVRELNKQNKTIELQGRVIKELLNKIEDNKSFDNTTIGKFKDTKSLLEAYNNLQSEFTRKCQKLSELEKQIESEQEKGKTILEELKEYVRDNSNLCVVESLDTNDLGSSYVGYYLLGDDMFEKIEELLKEMG